MRRVVVFRDVLVALIFLMAGSVYAQSTSTEICNDGKDNNGDGKIDCNDSFCNFAANIEKGCNCFDSKDNDGDGKIDAADTDCATYYGLTFVGSGSTCSIQPPPGTGFTGIGAPQTTQQNTADTPAKVVVGDINGDGFPDAAVCSKWNSTVQVIATATASGFSPGDIMSDFRTPGSKIFPNAGSQYVFEYEVMIADIDKDKKAEIFAIASQRGGSPNNPPTRYFLTGFKYAVKDLVPLFDAVDLGPDRPGNPGIADFDGDGKAEIYLKNRIYAAESGKLLADMGGNWDTQINSGPVAANITGDSKLELICGNFIYTVPSLSSRTFTALTLFADMNTLGGPKFYPKGFNDLTEYGTDQASSTSTADFDGDGFLDVLMTGAINCSGLEASPCGNNITTIFYWNVKKGTISTFAPPDTSTPNANGWSWGTGRINLGDANGDGKLEALFIAGNQLYCLGKDGSGNLTQLWVHTINDSKSGILALTVYDFDNNGRPEVVYRDSQELRMIDGVTGTNGLNGDPAVTFSRSCQSHTWTEGPIVADVNGDGGTDICVTCYTNTSFNINADVQQQSLGQTRLYYSSTNGWLPTRKVWNQHPYYVTNINDDLTLPYPQVDPSLVFSNAPCPNGLPGPQRPLNLFMNQVPRLSKEGCPVFPAPDLTFTGDTPSSTGTDTDGDGVYNPTVVVVPPICGNLDITAFFNIINNGDLPITDNVPVSFYNGDPTANPVAATFLAKTSIQITNLQVGQKVVSAPFTFPGPGTNFKLFIVLYNDGTKPLPLSLVGQSTKECSISNNVYSVDVTPSPVTATIEKISDNFKCANSAPDNGELRAHLFKGATEVTDFSPYKFQWYTGTGTTSPISAPAGTNYNLTDRAEGTYTLVVTDIQKGCSSIPVSMTIIRKGNDPDVNITVISHQTKCNPANGQLEANITGGNTGYTFEWYDIGLTPQGIIGPQANGLTAGSYVVFVSKDGCTKASTPATVNGPQIPDATAQVLQNVVDCSNPNSGSVQADASVNGVIQNPANYTFNWYFYNNATSTRGSILPPASGTGQTRINLAAGYYQAEVKDNLTQCSSGVFPVVQVQKQTVLPTAQITQLAPQTSCDPSNPNGILQGDALVGGVIQSPSTFTYQWFKGQNTLPANLHSAVSGTNGQIANNVAGGGIPYTLKVTSAQNCSATIDFVITENLIKPVLAISTQPNKVCDPVLGSIPYDGSVSATVTFNGGAVTTPVANYQFTWYRGPATTDPVIAVADNTQPLLKGLKEGDYTVVVERTDIHCKSTAQTKPVAKATVLPDLAPTSTGSNVCTAAFTPDGTATAVINNPGTDSYRFKWFDGNSIAGTPLTTGANSNNGDQVTAIRLGGPGASHTYTVLVTNATTGCQNNAPVSVADVHVDPVLAFATIKPNTICSPSSNWDGEINVQVTNIPVLYTITDYSFKWYDGNSTASPLIGGVTGTKLDKRDATFFTVESLNTKTGCTSTAITGKVPDGKVYPDIQIATTGSNNCTVGAGITPDGTAEATLSNAGSDSYTYLWSAVAPALPITVAGNNANQSKAIKLGGPNNAPNVYNVVVNNTRTNCASNKDGQVADVSKKPTFTLTPTPNKICSITVPGGPTQFNGHLDVSAITHPVLGSSTITYKWFDVSPADVITGPNLTSTTATLGNLDKGKHAATVTIDALGCTSDPVIQEVLDDLTPVVISKQIQGSTNCIPAKVDGQAHVTAPLGATFRYQWYNGSTVDPLNIIAGETSAVLKNDKVQGGPASNFAVEVTNLTDGCTANEPINVPDLKVTPTIAVSVVKNNTICDLVNINPDGELLATVAAMGTNYTIAWSGGFAGPPPPALPLVAGANGERFTRLLPNFTYTAHVTNNDTGCQSQDDSKDIINDLTYPAVAITITDQTSCSVTPNGALAVTPVAGDAYAWFDGAGTGTPHTPSVATSITQLASDDYTLRATTTSTGCVTTQTKFVPENKTNPVVTLTNSVKVTTCGTSPNGEAKAVVTGLLGGPAFPGIKYDIFYVFTKAGNTYPTDVATLTASADKIVNGTALPVPDHTGLAPGYLTAYVVDKNTSCESVINTVQIIDDTKTYNFKLDAKTQAGFCNAAVPGGGIEMTVERSDNPGVPCGTCSYAWYNGSPTNSNINFFNNPPVMSGAPLTVEAVNEDLGAPAYPTGVGAGTYTLIVIDNDPAHKDCGNYHTDFVPPSSLPTVSHTLTDITDCVTPNGKVDVLVSGGTSVLGYTIKIFEGPNSTGAIKGQLAVPAKPASASTLATLPKGEYYIEVKDNDATNILCPFGEIVILKQKVLPPLITINSTGKNTSCDPLNSADGSVTLTVKNDVADIEPKFYRVATIDKVIPLYATPNTIGAAGASGESETILKMSPTDYTITIKDFNSNCATDVVVTIPDVQDTPDELSITPTPETMCANLSNGSALASIANTLATDLDQFDFTWAQNNDLTSPVYKNAGDGAGTLGELLNRTHATAGTPGNFWTMGAAGMGSGDRVYYTQAIKNATAPSGVGCKTSIVQVVIADEHAAPDLTLVSTFNSFCSATALNPGDGSIAITADADPSTPGNQNSAGGFDFAWTNANALTTSPQHSGNTFTISNLGTNTYKITATNTTNACVVENSVDIDPAPFVVTVTDHDVTDQRICKPDGLIDLKEIIVDKSAAGDPNLVETDATPLTTNYNFKWYKAAAGTPGTFDSTPGQELKDGSNNPIDDQSLINGSGSGQYSSMSAGTYYVVATRKTTATVAAGCPALPYRVDVKDVHTNPVALLTPFSNTSCNLGIEEGEIKVKVSDATVSSFGPFTYTYTWAGTNPEMIGAAAPGTNDGDGFGGGENDATPAVDNDEDHPLQLKEGTYDITILNNQSGCQVAASTTIIKNATPVFIQKATVVDQILCKPDGSITVTEVTLNDRDGRSQTSGVDFPMTHFEFSWTRSASAFTQTPAGPLMDQSTYDPGFGIPFGADTYTVTAKRISGSPGRDCISAPFTIDIKDNKIYPVVSLTALSNTACSGAFEGEIKVKVADASPGSFSYTWDPGNAMAIASAPFPTGTNDGDGFGGGEMDATPVIDNDEDHPAGLVDGFYKLTVQNNTSQCIADGTTNIYKNSTPVFIPDVSSLPQVLCFPADGQAKVNQVTIKDRGGVLINAPTTEFDYTWTANDPSNSAIVGAVTETLNAVGFGPYYVVATRKVGFSPGSGCSSAPFKIDVDDQRKYPTASFTSVTNSSCSVLKPNGTVSAFAAEATGVNTDPYTFAWTLNGGALPGPTIQADNSNSSVLTNALDGNYVLLVTNTATGCPFTRNFALQLDQTKSTPNIIDVSSIDPTDCNPSASANVTKITLGSQTNSVLFPPNVPPNNEITGPALATFIYEWASGTPGNILVGQTAPAIANLVAGSYFVAVQDPSTDCKSGPKEVVISDDNIIYPVADITQTLKQISCISTVGTAALAATGDGSNAAPYTFTWYPTLDNTGSPINVASAPSIGSLTVGNYSVTVLNTVTNCSSNAAYIIPDDSPFYTPEVSLGGQPRTLCVGLDGAVLARVSNRDRAFVDPGYPFPPPLNFTASLYYGANPNMANPPDVPVMSLIPGFDSNFIQSNLAEGAYTVRITDNNTGCVGIATEIVDDDRVAPIVDIVEDLPMTNCDPIIANGQLSATADGGKVGGYTFDWYAGNAVTTPPGTLITNSNKLIGQRAGTYVVHVTRKLTGCVADKSGIITDKTVIPHLPVASVVQHRTNCIAPNGWVTANVEGDVVHYDFNWYNGNAVKTSVDFAGIDYMDVDIGPYAVTATDIITGCVSPPAIAIVEDHRVTPEFTFDTMPSYCSDTGKPKGIGSIQLNLSNPNEALIQDVQWRDVSTNSIVGTGIQIFELFPGFYQAEAITTEGCTNEGIAEVKTEISPYNGVSVNGDAQNDYFIIDCITNFPNNNVKIFNRSGILVYEIDGYNNADLSFKGFGEVGVYVQGKELPVGTYFYIIDKRDGSKPVAGYLELDR